MLNQGLYGTFFISVGALTSSFKVNPRACTLSANQCGAETAYFVYADVQEIELSVMPYLCCEVQSRVAMKLVYQLVEFDVRIDDEEAIVYIATINDVFQVGFIIKKGVLELSHKIVRKCDV